MENQMQPASCAADARCDLQQSLLRASKSAAEEEASVMCAALAAVKGWCNAWPMFPRLICPVWRAETLLATSAALAHEALKCVSELFFVFFCPSTRWTDAT